MNQNELAHFGIQGQKWGIRRYQYEDGSLTPEGRKHYGYGIRGVVDVYKERKQKKERAKRLEAARAAKKAKKEHEENRERVLKSGNATEVMKYKGEMSEQELNSAINRIRNENALAELAARERPKTIMEKADSAASTIKKAVDIGNKIADGYNFIAKINNSLSEDHLPIIGKDKEKPKADTKAMKEAKNFIANELDSASAKELQNEISKLGSIYAIESFAKGDNGKKGK